MRLNISELFGQIKNRIKEMLAKSEASELSHSEKRRKFSYRKIALNNGVNLNTKFSKDPGIYFSREDKFEGKFEWKNGLILKRGYLEH